MGNETDLLPDCGNDVCGAGENCLSCPADCISGTTGGFDCGNGVCEDGETCFTCAVDCAGAGQDFCCYGGSTSPSIDIAVSCTDSRCGLNECDTEASPQVSYCCGDGICDDFEVRKDCPLDCTCGDFVCNSDLGENVENCPSDCACNANYQCEAWE